MSELQITLRLTPWTFIGIGLDKVSAPFKRTWTRFCERRTPRFWVVSWITCYMLFLAMSFAIVQVDLLIPRSAITAMATIVISLIIAIYTVSVYAYFTAVEKKALNWLLKFPVWVAAIGLFCSFVADRLVTNHCVYWYGTAGELSILQRMLYRVGLRGWQTDAAICIALAVIVALTHRHNVRKSVYTRMSLLADAKSFLWFVTLTKCVVAISNYVQLMGTHAPKIGIGM